MSDSQRRIAELTTLNALAQTLNRALDLHEALDTALPHIVDLMGLQTGWIFLRDGEESFRLAARHDLPPAIGYPGSAWVEECTCQELCLHGRLNKAVNIVRCSRLRHAIGDKRSLAQHASVPLVNGEQVLQAPLEAGDLLRIGGFTFAVELSERDKPLDSAGHMQSILKTLSVQTQRRAS